MSCTLAQFLRYGIAGGSALGFLCAIPVNYRLRHRFVFRSRSDHGVAAARYVATTLAGLVPNTVLFAARPTPGNNGAGA